MSVKAFRKVKAILLAAILFVGLHFALTIVANIFAQDQGTIVALLPWLNLTAYCLYILIGSVGGALSGERFIIVGFLAGFFSALLAVSVFGVGGDSYRGVLITLGTGSALGGIGGSLSMLWSRRSSHAL